MSWSQINRCLPKEPHPAHEHEESFSIWQWTIAAANLFQELWRQVHSSRLTFLFDSSRHKLPCDQDSGLPGMSGAPLSRLVPFPALTRLPTSGVSLASFLLGRPRARIFSVPVLHVSAARDPQVVKTTRHRPPLVANLDALLPPLAG